MRFWDSSALVPLLVEEPLSASCRDLLRADAALAVWVLTRTEVCSAVRRKERAHELNRPQVRQALGRLVRLEAAWTEIDALRPVRDRADRLLAAHPLRAADALQLAAALLLVQERPAAFPFVTADERLSEAAEAEGFAVTLLGRDAVASA